MVSGQDMSEDNPEMESRRKRKQKIVPESVCFKG